MTNSIFQQVGNNIQDVLREKGKTQQYLADTLNISKQVMSKIVMGAKAINEELLLQEMRTYNVDKKNIDIKEIFILSNLFIVPYKTMVKRLYEIKLINQKRYNELMELSNAEVEVWRNRLALSIPTRNNKIGLSNLVDRAIELYEAKKMTSMEE